jgi:hypothetical protein
MGDSTLTTTQRMGELTIYEEEGQQYNHKTSALPKHTPPKKVPVRDIKSRKKLSEAERLDPRYIIVSSKDSRLFWRVGRVFMMLWTEPAGYTQGGGTKNHSHISITWLNESAFNEIRRFVVVQDLHGCCNCLAVHSYGGEGTLKKKLPDPENHAIIHTSKEPPEQLSVVDEYGETIFEELTKDPIKVNSECTDREGMLSPQSRINYSKIYCVEKDVRVLNIGMVDEGSMVPLMFDSPLKPTEDKHKHSRSSGSSHRKKHRHEK